jgi:hypothetical protein
MMKILAVHYFLLIGLSKAGTALAIRTEIIVHAATAVMHVPIILYIVIIQQQQSHQILTVEFALGSI